MKAALAVILCFFFGSITALFCWVGVLDSLMITLYNAATWTGQNWPKVSAVLILGFAILFIVSVNYANRPKRGEL